MLLTIGYTVPPLRAVLEGVAGARTRSESATAYPRPMVWRPRPRTSSNAMRRPRPLLRYPIANTKAPTISHTVLSENPLSIQRSDLLGSCST
jgi:hypothetical protein